MHCKADGPVVLRGDVYKPPRVNAPFEMLDDLASVLAVASLFQWQEFLLSSALVSGVLLGFNLSFSQFLPLYIFN